MSILINIQKRIGWSINYKLASLIGFLLTLLVVMLVVSYSKMNRISEEAQNLSAITEKIHSFNRVQVAALEASEGAADLVGFQLAGGFEEVSTGIDGWKQGLSDLQNLMLDEIEQKEFSRLENVLIQLEQDLLIIQDLVRDGQILEAKSRHQDHVEPAMDSLKGMFADIESDLTWDKENEIAAAMDAANSGIILLFGVSIGAILVGLGAGTLLVRSITQPIHALLSATTAMAEGDLSQQVEVSTKDELGVLAKTFNRMADNLRQQMQAERAANLKAIELAEAEREQKEYLEQTVDGYLNFVEKIAAGDLTARLTLNGHDDALTTLGHNLNLMVTNLGQMTGEIRQATVNIAAAASEILAATTQQASGASEQSAAITQTSTTIEEVKVIVEQAFVKAQVVAEQAQQTSQVSQAGTQAVTDTVDGMTQIKNRVEGIAENILALSEQTQQIGRLLPVSMR